MFKAKQPDGLSFRVKFLYNMLNRLVWAEINLRNYSYNFASVKKLVGPRVKIMAVVKANAYGHGAVEIANKAAKLGASYLGVACLYEARQLRESGNKLPILILGYTDAAGVSAVLDLNIAPNVMDEKVLKELDKQSRKRNKQTKIHIKIDSGMHRLGLLPEQALKFIPKIENYKNVILEGIFTHFATSDERDLTFTYKQLSIFNQCLKQLKAKKSPPLVHAANSAATLRIPTSHFSMVRPGIILYGLPPSDEFKLPFSPKPILTLRTSIVQLRRIGKGETVGYGRTYKADKNTIVASLPVGYADGFRRAPSNWGFVLIKGKKVPLLGRVSMDQSSADVTDIPNVKVGDEVVLIGHQGKEYISTEDVAKNLGTNNYEVISSMSSRISRIYLN